MDEQEAEAPAALKTGELKGRLAGALVVGLGALMLGAGWAFPAWFLMVSVLLGPMFIFAGVAMVIEGPEVPMRRGHTFVETMSSIGAAVSVLLYIAIRVAGLWASSGADA